MSMPWDWPVEWVRDSTTAATAMVISAALGMLFIILGVLFFARKLAAPGGTVGWLVASALPVLLGIYIIIGVMA